MILWVGGIVAAALAVTLAAEEARRGAAEAARKVALYVASPGMLLTWLVGLAVLIPNFSALYAKAGWMHGKLTLVFIASGLTGALSGMLRKIAAGDTDVKLVRLRILTIAIFVIAVIAIALVRFQPGGIG
jgi:putative membrane protein